MGCYAEAIGGLRNDLVRKENLTKKVSQLSDKLEKSQTEFVDLLDAQKLLSSISDENTDATLRFITGVVNKALSELFKSDERKITLKRKLYANSKPHIVVELRDSQGKQLDMKVQSGTGLSQVVSMLFVICLVEIRKGRRLILSDERFNGLHSEAKRIISEILKIFAEGGFQFIFVEYALNDLGKIYNVEKVANTAYVYPLGEGRTYHDSDIFIFSDVDMSVVDKENHYSDEEDDLSEEINIG